MSCAPSFSARARKCGYGWLYAGRLAGWWPSPWATVAEQPANVYGKRSPKATKGQQLATVTFLGGLPRGGDLLTMSATRSEEHTSELQSRQYLVCRLLLEKKQSIFFSRRRIR